MKYLGILPAIALALAACPVQAERVALSIPPGSLSQVAIALARKTNTSIVIADPALARRQVLGVSGHMDSTRAIRSFAEANGLRAIRVAPRAWRLVAAPRPQTSSRSQSRTRQAPILADAPPPETRGDPIVVTASKRDTALTDLAAQATLIDGELLEIGGVGGTERITQRTASVSSTYLGSGRNKLFIRGVADSSFTGPTQATVGQYFGDLRLSYNAPDPDLRLSDMERVEILEGPQGTLYGAGSLGGIIRLVPRAPEAGETSLSVSGGASAIQNGEPGGDGHLTVNLPLAGETATLRANVDVASLGGYIDKPAIGQNNVNRTRILSGRAALRVELAPQWTADLIALGQDTDAQDSQYSDRAGERLENSAVVKEDSSAKYGQAQLVVSGRIGDVRIKSSTGISGQDLFERYDATAEGEAPRIFEQRNQTRMIANETRIWQPLGERFGWVLGTSLVDNRNTLTRGLFTEGLETTSTGVRNTVFEITGYSEASYRLTPSLVLSGGLRVTNVKIGGEGEDVLPQLALAGRAITATRKETTFLPSASLLSNVGSDGRIYVRYQESFRPGGLAVSGNFVRQFRSDYARTVELGGGWGLPGRGDFDLSANLSYTRWNNIQADFIDAGGLPSTANIGDGTIIAASVAGSVRLADGLRAEFGATINDSEVDEPELPVFLAMLELTRIPNIARFSGRAGIQWHHEFADGTRINVDSWASYVGKSRLGIGPELGDPQGNYFDSGLSLRFGREGAGLTLSLTNIANSEGNRFALGTPFSTGREQTTPLQPRTLRIGFDGRF